ncbi:L-dopachrome tautomerase-related protein [Parafilimonas sp.]|uniref:L-dopachrome tautomerase-related protein n=1 Tax=Parafilimonas sp. TaxID=1969739 RepID=UPI0039E22F7D
MGLYYEYLCGVSNTVMMKVQHIILFVCLNIFFMQAQAQQLKDNVSFIAHINPPNPDPSGIALSKTGRIFLGFPRHADNHTQFALAELVNEQLIPFPDSSFIYPSAKPYKEWLVSPHGMYMDKNDVLWILDDGKRAGIQEIPEGAAKVVAIDINTKRIVHTLVIPANVLSSNAHYNDLRVDLTHGAKGTVYIANSGFGERYSLVVIDVASGKTREVLLNQPSTSPESKFMAFLEGKPHVADMQKQTFPQGGADGIALSPDSKKLFWTAISSRNLYSINTDTLSNFSLDETTIEKAVMFEGQHPACDGLAEDDKGNIYFGAFEQQSIVKRTPDGECQLLAHNAANFVWPDGLAYHGGYVYVTLGQWNRLAGFNNGKDLRKPPYLVAKIKAD